MYVPYVQLYKSMNLIIINHPIIKNLKSIPWSPSPLEVIKFEAPYEMYVEGELYAV